MGKVGSRLVHSVSYILFSCGSKFSSMQRVLILGSTLFGIYVFIFSSHMIGLSFDM